MAQEMSLQLKELGLKLESPPVSKDALIKLLKQAAMCLSELDQSPPKLVVESMQPLLNAFAKQELLKHQDREIKLFVAYCICEITRITAPEAPYDDDVLKDIFQLIVSTFSGLNDINGPSFGRRVVILETLARYRSCVVMLDLECDDLINEMFNTFFAVARDELPGNVLAAMQTIMEVILEESEDVPENLLTTLLSILGREKENVTLAAKRLAMNVIENSAAQLETSIKQFLVSSMSGDNRPQKCGINYHAVLYDIYRCAPQILSGVVPYLTGELLSDQLDIRMRAVGIVGDLFSVPGSTISEAFKPVFLEFLKRLTDRVVEVRMSVLEYIKTCLLENPFRGEAHQLISALCDRLLDYDENVRKQVVSVVCDVACHALTSIPVDTIKLVSDRLRDKSVLVKRYAMERLADIYRVSCMKQSTGSTMDDEYDWVVRKILRCFYDKDFRSDTIEPILSLSLFPSYYSVKDKVTKWVRIFSGFDKVEAKALEKILEQKRRLQQEMQKYISLRKLSQKRDGADIQRKVIYSFRVMSRGFTDPVKAEENFQNLDQLRDSNIWNTFMQLLDPNTSSPQACSLRDKLLKILGQKHPLHEFLSILSLRCSYLLFDKEHVRQILVEAAVHKSSGSSELILSCMTLLVILARFCPLLLRGIEENLVHLLEDDNDIMKEATLHILAKAGGAIQENLGVSSRSLDLILERICIEGNRRQAKYAVHALASITKDDGLMSLSVLYKRLIDMLEEKSHLPAVLQSLGCISQAAMPVFVTRENEVEKFIKENILELGHMTVDKSNDCWDERSQLCSLKIFGVKALVKSYLPVKDAHLRPRIDDLIGMLKNILLFGDISREIVSSSVDKAHLKLAAAKAVLRLLKNWEHRIPVDVLYLTLRTSEDNFPEVKKLLLNKVHQYVRDRILDPKFACAFLLDISSESYFEENKRYLNDIIHMCRQGRDRQISLLTDAMSPPLYPEYILPYVVHSLAHHPLFPDDDCKDVQRFEPIYRQLYLFLSTLIHGDADGKSHVSMGNNKESISVLKSIVRCIRRSEDAFNSAKSKNLYALCDLSVPIIRRLAPDHGQLQDSSVSVALPPLLYRTLEKKEENDTLAEEAKTWLADEGILTHFESLELEANKIVEPATSEDDITKDSETESELPLGKLMKRLKAKASKTKKEAKNDLSEAGVANESDFDVLKMLKEINSDNHNATSKFGSSKGRGHAHKKRSDHEIQKSEILFSEPVETPEPKRRRTSAQAQKSTGAVSTKGSKRSTNVYQVNANVDFDTINEESRISSEQHMQEKTAEPWESESLSSLIMKNSRSMTKHKHYDRDHAVSLNDSPQSKKPKKISDTDRARSKSSKLGSLMEHKSMTGLGKCTTKNKGRSTEDLIGCRIKVWWPNDKQYYEGVVKSFDSEKNKHVILYDDGDVEVLRLDRERWELVGKGPKVKHSGSSKDFTHRGSSGKRRKLAGHMQEKKLGEKSSISQVKSKRTPRRRHQVRLKIKLKSESSEESGEIPDVTNPKFTTKSSDASVSDKGPTKRIKKSFTTKELSDSEQEKQEEDLVCDDGEAKDTEKDSEDTNSDDNDHGSVDEAVLSESREEVDEEDNHASDSVDMELSDYEPLSMWKQRSGKK